MTGGRLVLLHGSVTNAALSWERQRALGVQFALVTPNRPGFPPNPPVTGDHEPAFDAVADVICAGLGAERAVLPGAGHAVQNAPGFNELLVEFVRRAGRNRRVR